MTGCVYGRQVCCSFNSQGQELLSLPVCHEGRTFPGCYASAEVYWGKHGPGSGAGHLRKPQLLPRLCSHHWPWASCLCGSEVLNSQRGLPLREMMVFPGITLALLVPGAGHSNLSTRRRNYAAESRWETVDFSYKGTTKENFKRKL